MEKVLSPVKDAVLTQGFSDKHPAYDLAPKVPQAPVRAARPGKVKECVGKYKTNWYQGTEGDPTPMELTTEDYGNYALVECLDGFDLYAHLQPFNASELKGKELTLGEDFAWVGNTGNSSGPHCHYEYRDKENKNQAVEFYEDATPEEELVPVSQLSSRCRTILLDPDIKDKYYKEVVEFNFDQSWTYEKMAEFGRQLFDRATKAEADANYYKEENEKNSKELTEVKKALEERINENGILLKKVEQDFVAYSQKILELNKELGEIIERERKLITRVETLEENEKTDLSKIEKLTADLTKKREEILAEPSGWEDVKRGIMKLWKGLREGGGKNGEL